MKEDLILGNCFWKCFYGHVECNSDKILSEKKLPEGQPVFAQCQKTMKRTYNFFQGKFFPQNVLLDTRNAVLTTPPKKSNGRPIKFASCKNILKYRFFAQKTFLSKLFYGHVKGNFDNLAERNSSKGRSFPSIGQEDRKFLSLWSFFAQKSSTDM